MMESQRELFKQEAYELLGELESSLLELESNPDDREVIGRVFRTLHTIKGSGAMFGFDAIAAFTHEVENAFEMVRSGILPVTKGLVDLTLSSGDMVRSMLDGPDDAEIYDKTRAESILSSVRQLIPTPVFSPAQSRQDQPRPSAGAEENATYHIRFRPKRNLFLKGTNPVLLLNELRELGECTVVANTDDAPDFDELNPEECFTHWDIILTTGKGVDAIRDVFIFIEDDCELDIETIDYHGAVDDEQSCGKIGEILVERGYIAQDDLDKVLAGRKRIGELLVDAGLVDVSKVGYALAEQQHVRQIQEKRQRNQSSSTIRVPTEKLDTLVDLVGELVTVQARLTQTVASRDYSHLLSIAEEVERLAAELRDNTMGIRMLPIGTTFNSFRRLVRDLSNELGKEVVLVTDGAETELDKTVIERLKDPLVHLIRNSIDHGIEAPDIREAAGKSRQGTVRLSAIHSGADVLIRIEDDGAGLDGEAIRAKAIEKGIVARDAELSEKQTMGLLFAPGFSTAERLTSVSGRGVGMDVVKRNVEAIRGSIDIESKKGFGTTITLKLPLTLAIIDGLLIAVGDARFVLPLSSIEECVELIREDVARPHGREMISLRGSLVPYIRLREQYGINGGAPPIEQVVVTETQMGKVGFVVDKVIGEHQTVIKSLGRMYLDVQGISGATILGDGSVALIIDVHDLVQKIEMEEMTLN